MSDLEFSRWQGCHGIRCGVAPVILLTSDMLAIGTAGVEGVMYASSCHLFTPQTLPQPLESLVRCHTLASATPQCQTRVLFREVTCT